jgi:predicted lipid-binding transport protein (Tim44 family)
MDDGFQFIDIIFFAMIAAFLVLRLRGALGRRDGHKGQVQNPFKDDSDDKNDTADDNVIPLKEISDDHDDESIQEVAKEPVDELLLKGIGEIDPNFNKDEFLSGAKVAFDLILSAYSNGDTPSLKPLLNEEVFANFSQVIQDREQAKQTMEDTLVSISSAEIVEAFAENNIENITVKYVSEQVNVIRDENGEVVDGDPSAVIETIDFWTFARDAKSNNPNWALVATNSLD